MAGETEDLAARLRAEFPHHRPHHGRPGPTVRGHGGGRGRRIRSGPVRTAGLGADIGQGYFIGLTCLVAARQFAALQDYGRLAERYQELASIDGMTGLFNRLWPSPAASTSGPTTSRAATAATSSSW